MFFKADILYYYMMHGRTQNTFSRQVIVKEKHKHIILPRTTDPETWATILPGL